MTTLSKTDRQVLANKLSSYLGSESVGNIIEVNYSGAINGNDVFLSTNDKVVYGNPMMDGMGAVEYYNRLRASPPQRMVTYKGEWGWLFPPNSLQHQFNNALPYKELDGNGLNLRSQVMGASDKTSPYALSAWYDTSTPLPPVKVDVTNFSSTATSVNVDLACEWYGFLYAGLNADLHDRAKGSLLYDPSSDAAKLDIVTYAAYKVGADIPGPTWMAEDQMDASYFGNLVRGKVTALKGLSLISELGAYVTSVNMGNNPHTTRTFNITNPAPYVAGLNRLMLIFGNGKNKLCTVVVYVVGMETDTLVLSVDGVAIHGSSSSPLCNISLVKPLTAGLTQSELEKGYKTKHIDTALAYPLTFNDVFVDTYYGKTQGLILEETLVGEKGKVIKYWTMNFVVDHITGHVSKSDLETYLKTGYGVAKPKSEGDIAKIMSSWNKIPNSIVYRYGVYECKDFSLLKTSVAKEYKRKREKACKEDNFLELKFNDEYSMKQVENKLKALTTLNCLSYDASMIGSASVSDRILDGTKSFSIEKSETPMVLSWSTSDSKKGNMPSTADAVSSLIDELGKNGEIYLPDASAVSLVQELFGLDISEAQVGERKASASMTLRVQDFDVPEVPAFHHFVTQGYDAATSLLALQVTDYAQFNATIPKLIRSLQGTQILPGALTKLVEASDAAQ